MNNRAFSWPVGLRHEAVSAWMLEDSQGWHEQVEAEHRSLVTHLVGSHHGYNRPLFAPVADPSAGISITKVEVAGLSYETSSRASSIDWEKPAGFEQLNYQYSPWGLAYLEAIVRFADLWVSSEGS